VALSGVITGAGQQVSLWRQHDVSAPLGAWRRTRETCWVWWSRTMTRSSRTPSPGSPRWPTRPRWSRSTRSHRVWHHRAGLPPDVSRKAFCYVRFILLSFRWSWGCRDGHQPAGGHCARGGGGRGGASGSCNILRFRGVFRDVFFFT